MVALNSPLTANMDKYGLEGLGHGPYLVTTNDASFKEFGICLASCWR